MLERFLARRLKRHRPFRAERLLLGAAAALFVLPTNANELRAFEDLLARPVSRAILETTQGRALLALFGAEDSRALAQALSAAEYRAYRAELEGRLREAESLVARSRETDPARRALDAEARLNHGERRFVGWYAERSLRLSGVTGESAALAGRESRIAGGAIDFTGREAAGRGAESVSAEGLFLRPSGPVNLEEMLARVPETAGAVARAHGERGVRGFFRRVNECLRTRSASVENEHFMRYLIGDVVIGEAFTVGGYISATGVKNIRLADLTTDIATTFIAKVASNSLMRGNISLRARWIRATGLKVGRVGVDATIFFLNPIAEDETPEGQRAHRERGMDRLEYNTMWAAGTAPITAGVYHLVQGLSCLGAQNGWRWVGPGTFLGRVGVDAVTTLVYFELRERYMH